MVASSAEKGGTRSGALENLRAGWVPLHVRDDGSPGNRRLIADGGMPLPADALIEQLDVQRLTRNARPSLLAPDIAMTSVAESQAPLRRGVVPDSPATIDDAFLAVWPILAEHLLEPRSEREVADRVKLELTQARAWLKRAVDEQRVELKLRPKRYVLREATVEQLRIDTDWHDHR